MPNQLAFAALSWPLCTFARASQCICPFLGSLHEIMQQIFMVLSFRVHHFSYEGFSTYHCDEEFTMPLSTSKCLFSGSDSMLFSDTFTPEFMANHMHTAYVTNHCNYLLDYLPYSFYIDYRYHYRHETDSLMKWFFSL